MGIPKHIHDAIEIGHTERLQDLKLAAEQARKNEEAEAEAEKALRASYAARVVAEAEKWFVDALPLLIRSATRRGENRIAIGTNDVGQARAEVCERNGLRCTNEYYPGRFGCGFDDPSDDPVRTWMVNW